RLRQAEQVVLHQGDVGRLDRDAGAGGTHRHADVGGGQRGRVVDAVTDHGHGVALPLQLLDGRELVLRQESGTDLVDAGLPAHRPTHRLDVAGHHDDLLHTRVVESAHHLGGVLADTVGDGDDPDDPAVAGDDHRCAALGGELGDRGAGRGQVVPGRVLRLDERKVADGDAVTVERGDEPLAEI